MCKGLQVASFRVCVCVCVSGCPGVCVCQGPTHTSVEKRRNR